MNFYNDITIIIISYKSTQKTIELVNTIPNLFKIIIVDNSSDIELKKSLNDFKNVEIYFSENNGVGSSINFAVSKIKTNYFFQISPDIIFNFDDLKLFYNKAKEINNNFSALGPRFLNVDPKGHKQSNIQDELGYIESIHGSAMFINKDTFDKLNGFDENIFLYFEETDFCKRCEKKGFKAYQLNKVKIKKDGRSVKTNNESENKKLERLLAWHFIWSKYYFYKKHYGRIFSIIYFQPILLRCLFKMIALYFINKDNCQKYRYRADGLLTSMLNKNSYLRIDKI